jgi:outer membrane phospholipase A
MTREQAKELWPIVKAFSEGEAVQFRDDAGNWYDYDTDEGYFAARFAYRIQPEPRVIWVNEYVDGLGDSVFLSEVGAQAIGGGVPRKFVEEL